MHRAVAELIKFLPEVEAELEADLLIFGPDYLESAHSVYWQVFNPRLMTWLAEPDEAPLRRIFEFIERLATAQDERLENLVMVTICERIGDEPELLARAYAFMGTRTRQLSDKIERFWGRL